MRSQRYRSLRNPTAGCRTRSHPESRRNGSSKPPLKLAPSRPFAQWPGSLRAPQCLIEAWRLATRADARAYLLTARGFGRTRESQVWLQMELVITGERDRTSLASRCRAAILTEGL